MGYQIEVQLIFKSGLYKKRSEKLDFNWKLISAVRCH